MRPIPAIKRPKKAHGKKVMAGMGGCGGFGPRGTATGVYRPEYTGGDHLDGWTLQEWATYSLTMTLVAYWLAYWLAPNRDWIITRLEGGAAADPVRVSVEHGVGHLCSDSAQGRPGRALPPTCPPLSTTRGKYSSSWRSNSDCSSSEQPRRGGEFTAPFLFTCCRIAHEGRQAAPATLP